MSKKYQTFPGMDDILPGEIEKWQWLENRAHVFFQAAGFREIRTPLLEPTDLFVRSIGQTTDIVHKEMFTFEDRGQRSMTLRPEMTASIVRAVIQNGLLITNKQLALYYLGAMFRAERPQAGRKRQFHQIGIELINHQGVASDFRCIEGLYRFLTDVGIKAPKLKVNDLSQTSGPAAGKVREELKHFFEQHKSKLDKDSLYRLDKNVLRIFDSKDERTQAVIEKAPWEEIAPLSDEFKQLCEKLTKAGIPFEISRRLVRGLDYYTGTVFEVSLPGLGAQDAVAGGGRYDSLFSEFGGGEVPCTGFSLGTERLLLALEKNDPSVAEQIRRNFIYFAFLTPAEETAFPDSLETVRRIRQLGFRIEIGSAANLGDHLKKANKLGAKFVLIRGADEIQKKMWTWKDMDAKSQDTVTEEKLFDTLIHKLQKD